MLVDTQLLWQFYWRLHIKSTSSSQLADGDINSNVQSAGLVYVTEMNVEMSGVGVAEKGLVVMLVYCGRVATSQINFIWWTLGFFFYFTSFFSSCSAGGALSLFSNTFFWFYWNWRKDKDWLKVYPLRDSNRMTYERDLQLMLLTSGDSLKYSNNTIICFSFTQYPSLHGVS